MTKPSRSPITTHVAAFLLGILAGLAAHPCTGKPPSESEPPSAANP